VTCHSSRHCRSARTPAQWAVWGTVARIVVTDPRRSARRPTSSKPSWPPSTWRAAASVPTPELRVACWAGGRPVTVSPLLARLVSARPRRGPGHRRRRRPDRGRGVVRARLRPGLRGHHRAGGGARGSGVRHPGLEGRAPHRSYADGSRGGAAGSGCDREGKWRPTEPRPGSPSVSTWACWVALGGDIATAGPGPAGGWRVLVPGPAGRSRRHSTSPSRGRPGHVEHGRSYLGSPRRTAATTSSTPRTAGPPRPYGGPCPWPRTAACGPTRSAPRPSFAATRRPTCLARAPSRLVTPSLDVLRVGGWPS